MLTCHGKRARTGCPANDFTAATLVPSVSLSAISRTFNSLFKVLFIFPSRYLFAIGLSPIFSLRWNIPPTLDCIPKQSDSLKVNQTRGYRIIYGILTLHDVSFQRTCTRATIDITSTNYNSPKRFQIWAHPGSFAITEGIPVGFFSSAY